MTEESQIAPRSDVLIAERLATILLITLGTKIKRQLRIIFFRIGVELFEHQARLDVAIVLVLVQPGH